MSWTDERIALLKKMWKDGKSAAEIAKSLARGVTRNAVIGKAHRMGLSGRPSPIKKTEEVPKKETAKASRKAVKEAKTPKEVAKKPVVPVVTGVKNNPLVREVAPPRPFVKEEFPADGGVALIDLTERMCKWPLGDPREDRFTFCGRSIRPGMPYCPDHASMAYQSSPRTRAAASEEKVVEESADDDESVTVT